MENTAKNPTKKPCTAVSPPLRSFATKKTRKPTVTASEKTLDNRRSEGGSICSIRLSCSFSIAFSNLRFEVFPYCEYAPHSLQGNEAHSVLPPICYFSPELPLLCAVAFFWLLLSTV